MRRDSQRQIVLVTDGQIGFEAEVMAKLGKSLPSGVRVHAIGIGAAVNRTLTSQVARAGRGVELIADGPAAAGETARRARAATVRPILTEVLVGGSALAASAPESPRDVLAGQPLVIAAELKDEGGVVEVRARLAGSDEAWVWRTQVGPRAIADTHAGTGAEAAPPGATIPSTPLPVGALYGREAIADLEARPLHHGRDAETLDAAIEALGMRHRITSRRTSLVAIAEEPSVDPLAPRRREKLPVEVPYGVSAEGVGLMGVPGQERLSRSAAPLGLAETWGQFKGPSTKRTGVAFGKIESRISPGLERLKIPIGEALWIRGSELTFEIEVPEDGFLLPQGELDATFQNGDVATVAVVPDQSAPEGPHVRGTRIRITVRLTEGTWPDRGGLILDCPDPRSGTYHLACRIVVRLDSARRARADA